MHTQNQGRLQATQQTNSINLRCDPENHFILVTLDVFRSYLPPVKLPGFHTPKPFIIRRVEASVEKSIDVTCVRDETRVDLMPIVDLVLPHSPRDRQACGYVSV